MLFIITIKLLLYFNHIWRKNYPESYFKLKSCACDISEDAIQTAKKNAIANQIWDNIAYLKGNLFDPLIISHLRKNSRKFDVILFNPPYLPTDKKIIRDDNRTEMDYTWEGGIEGDELTLKFIKIIPEIAKKGAEFLFISSSQVNQDRILNWLKENNISVMYIKKKHIFFEDIICYITKII